MTTHIETDVIIVGGGLAGLTLASILGDADIDVVCIDREKPSTQLAETFDGRTTALSYGTQRVLSAGGVWPSIEKEAEPILDIRVADGHSPLFLHFDSKEAGNPFGWIVENRLLRQALFKRAAEVKQVQHLAPTTVESFDLDEVGVTVTLADGKKVTAPLLVGADGRNSICRQWADIPVTQHDYQTAIVCVIAHERPHQNLAVENFLPSGPFAVLPMTDGEDGVHRSSIVWSEHGPGVQAFLDMPAEVFDAELQERCGDYLGKVHHIGKRFSYPLKLQHAKSYVAPRMALVSEAAHVMHPIAGQGLNLGMRDLAALAELVVDAKRLGLDMGSQTLLKKYQRWRRGDTLKMIAATDGLNRLFSNDIAAVKFLRDVGLGAVHHIPPAKNFFMRQAMGLSSDLPRLVRGERL